VLQEQAALERARWVCEAAVVVVAKARAVEGESPVLALRAVLVKGPTRAVPLRAMAALMGTAQLLDGAPWPTAIGAQGRVLHPMPRAPGPAQSDQGEEEALADRKMAAKVHQMVMMCPCEEERGLAAAKGEGEEVSKNGGEVHLMTMRRLPPLVMVMAQRAMSWRSSTHPKQKPIRLLRREARKREARRMKRLLPRRSRLRHLARTVLALHRKQAQRLLR
jgi:hypothetical protein